MAQKGSPSTSGCPGVFAIRETHWEKEATFFIAAENVPSFGVHAGQSKMLTAALIKTGGKSTEFRSERPNLRESATLLLWHETSLANRSARQRDRARIDASEGRARSRCGDAMCGRDQAEMGSATDAPSLRELIPAEGQGTVGGAGAWVGEDP